MMSQYRQIKSQIPRDALLLFRLGDFYEMFFDDATEASKLLNLTLTHRNGVPMCGIPHHAADGYIGKLLKAGRKVAVCDQTETPKPGKLVKRDITQILSPGAHFDSKLLSDERNNFLAAICPSSAKNLFCGLALIDLTTGEFLVAELDSADQLQNELARTQPAEIVCPTESFESLKQTGIRGLMPYDGWTFEPETAFFTLRDHFKTQSLDGFGVTGLTAGIGAAGGALHYVQQSLRRDTRHVLRLRVYAVSDYMVLDAVTQRNLELLESPRSGRAYTLVGCLDRTVTPMGARLMREWLTHPLMDVSAIHQRQDAIATFCGAPHLLAEFREQLRTVRDLERTLARLSVGSGNARDLVAVKDALVVLPGLKKALGMFHNNDNLAGMPQRVPNGSLFDLLCANITEQPELVDLISRAIVDAPPMTIRDRNVFRPSFNAELDELVTASTGGKEWIAKLQQDEIERTGIASLKVRYNDVFGYYIEVTKANLAKVPPDYIRKQTVVNGERFYTPALKEKEDKIRGADDKADALAYNLFHEVRATVLAQSAAIQQTASALAALDVLAGLAELARHQNYARPEINEGNRIEIVDGRHPVLEQTLVEDRFVPNDVTLDDRENLVLVITGPNMAGKSTYIRQVALLVLMAQIGSYLPATRATIGIVDRIFTRIGASDDLARGQSTFMVEMNETANILHNATGKSLIILDEIGRGTSTFDGLSIAWSVAEHLHNVVGAKTLFATHYHELTELAQTLSRVKNLNVAVREWHDQVIFLHKILPGSADKSYGIQVARLAGLPKPVIDRAKEVLANLEETELSADGQPAIARHDGKQSKKKNAKVGEPPPQLYLFGK